MFLKLLKIDIGSESIREIKFHKGLNLIVDETDSKNTQESGNNVGKTTVLRLIDFCLGSKGENIYKDVEFKEKHNTEIEEFLKSGITVTLILKEDLDNPESKEIKIKRNFLNYKNKIQEIDDIQYNNDKFTRKLKELIFENSSDKPTFRQIISKNIRDEKGKLTNTIKTLHQNTTLEEYEALFLFWLGIYPDEVGRKSKLQELKKTENKVIRRLKQDSSQAELEQAILVINRDISDLDKQKSNFNLNENFEEDLYQLNITKSEINKIATEIGKLNMRRDLILESKSDLTNESVNINFNQLEELYKSTKSFFPELHKKYEDLVHFHNVMIKEKVKFITEELPQLEHKIDLNYQKLKENNLLERKISQKLSKSGAVEELEVIIDKLNKKFEQKGKIEEQLRQWKISIDKMEKIDFELKNENDKIISESDLISKRITELNKYFSKLSERLYNEQFIASMEKGDRAYELKISNIGSNLGTGKKKGQIAAFDFAYIQFCDELGIPCLHFILHDQIENIHGNQIKELAEIANDTDSQYVAPILKDKLPEGLDVSEYVILTLSQKDKLFRI